MTAAHPFAKLPLMEQMPAGALQYLLNILKQDGFEIIGPRLRDQAIVYDRIDKVTDLPQGWTETQEKGRYRIQQRGDRAYFGFTVGPESWKKYLFPPRERLWTSRSNGKGDLEFIPNSEKPVPRAFLGVRACEIAAIQIQDRVFLEGAFQDRSYQERRRNSFILAVQCMTSASTCFCHSMQTGPEVKEGFDLLMVELLHPVHRFLLKAGTQQGEKVLCRLRATGELSAAGADGVHEASEQAATVAKMQTRRLDPREAAQVLARSHTSPRWDDVASRCINCANCTLVCPTCFCSSTEDTTDLKGEIAERWRRWDSCFTLDHSYLHGGGSVRASGKSRYRQWLTHKLSSWVDQFGVSGCVGCGRCVTWCPVGIDLTEEAEAIRRDKGN